jgi:hypothetical protein
MNMRCSLIFKAVAVFVLASAQGQETSKPLGAEWAALGIITGFHQAFDKQNHFEVRLLEADGSATVALNPISLYVVVTNNSSAADLQQRVWLLPYRVSRVKGIKLVRGVLQINGEIDADPSDSSKQTAVRLDVEYTVSDGVLGDTVAVSKKQL